MKSFFAATNIQAPAETIWSLLTNAALFPSWNSTIEAITGMIAPGETITLHTKAAPRRGFRLKVTGFEPARRMVWA